MKHTLENRTESAHHGVSVVAWPSAIRHSKSANSHFKSAERHSKSAKWHSSYAKWHAAPPLYIRAIPCNFAFSNNFFKDRLTLIKIFFFWVKLRHSDVSNSLVFKNHHLHHCFQKLIKSSFFFKTYEFMFQTRGIRLWLIHFQKKSS